MACFREIQCPITGKGCVEISRQSHDRLTFDYHPWPHIQFERDTRGKVRETSIAITFKRAALFLSPSFSFVRDILISLVARRPRSKRRNESSVVRASFLTDFKYLSNNREDRAKRAIRRANSLGYRAKRKREGARERERGYASASQTARQISL